MYLPKYSMNFEVLQSKWECMWH